MSENENDGQIRMILTGPASMYEDILVLCETVFEKTGQVVKVGYQEFEAGEEPPPVRRSRSQASPTTTTIPGRNQVVYEVLNPHCPRGTSRAIVHTYLVRHPRVSARQIMGATGLNRKQTESALHNLRTEGFVRSVAVV